jgi:hypothetical protein
MLSDQVPPGGAWQPLPHAGQGVSVGVVNERAEDFAWMHWREFAAAYPGADV